MCGIRRAATVWAMARRLRPFNLPRADQVLDVAAGFLPLACVVALARATDDPPLALVVGAGLALLATVIYVPVCVAAPFVFEWIFGRVWHVAGWLMLLLLPVWWTAAVVSPVSRLLVVVDRPALKLVFDVVFLVVPIVTMYALRDHGMNVAIFGYGIAACVAYILYAALLNVASAARPA